jgi:hypothetical protein
MCCLYINLIDCSVIIKTGIVWDALDGVTIHILEQWLNVNDVWFTVAIDLLVAIISIRIR